MGGDLCSLNAARLILVFRYLNNDAAFDVSHFAEVFLSNYMGVNGHKQHISKSKQDGNCTTVLM